MHVRYMKDAEENREFGCDLQRFFPWRDVVRTSGTSWGTALATVRPGEGTVPHSHDEYETFIVTAGNARMTIGDESSRLSVGDVVYIPPNSEHDIRNLSDAEPLQFVTIWWKASRRGADEPEEFSDAVMMSMTSCAVPGADGE